MANLSIVIVPAKILKGGKHKIRISIAHNSETRYFLTDIVINSDKEFKNGQVVKRDDAAYLNTKLRRTIQEIQKSIDEINGIECLTCSEIIEVLEMSKNQKRRTITSVFNEYIQIANLKPNTIKLYEISFKSIECFMGKDMLIRQLNHKLVLSYDKFLRDSKVGGETIKLRMRILSTLTKYAQRCQYAEFPINPFAGYVIPERTIRQSWLTVEQIKTIRDIQTTQKGIIKCRDIFMLSYYLGGINLIDLLKINFDQCSHKLIYVRTKTERIMKANQQVEFTIPEEAIPLILKYKEKNGRLRIGTDYQQETIMHQFLNYNIARLAKLTNINNLVYYSARKSFSQHAFLLGVNTGVIDYILGHKIGNVSTCLYSYIKVTPEMATEAIRKVLDNLK